MNEMESVESSLKQMSENVNAVQATAIDGLVKWRQDKLDECQSRWNELSKRVRKPSLIYMVFIMILLICCQNVAIYSNYALICRYIFSTLEPYVVFHS